MPQFKLKSKIQGFKSLDGMTAQVFNEDGELLDSINLNDSKSKLKFSFDKDDAFQGSKNADLTIKLTDTNGSSVNLEQADGTGFDLDSDEQTFTARIKSNKKKGRSKIKPSFAVEQGDTDAPVFTSADSSTVSEDIAPGTVVYDAEAIDQSSVSFSLSGSDADRFSINSSTGEVTFNASPDASSKSIFNFDVVATDAAGNSSNKAVALNVTPANVTGNTITLSAQSDVYSEAVGGQVIGTEFVENGNRFTSTRDTVLAAPGTIGFGDDLSDTTAGDADQLNLGTNAANNLQAAAALVSKVAGVENFNISATNDDSAAVNLAQFSGLDSIAAGGTFQNNVSFTNYLNSGARNLDFSDVSTGGVTLADNTFATSDAITMLGSGAADVLKGNNGAATISGGNGIDTIDGSLIAGSSITGGNGRDVIDLKAANAVDRVNLATVTTQTNGDDITGFVGANTNAAAADLLVFDAATFTTYTAGTPVQQANQATANASNTSNLFIVDTDANIKATNTLTGQGTLALRNDAVGTLYYSSNGDFTSNAVDIGTINDFANFAAVQNTEII